jgi:hypothetical protein
LLLYFATAVDDVVVVGVAGNFSCYLAKMYEIIQQMSKDIVFFLSHVKIISKKSSSNNTHSTNNNGNNRKKSFAVCALLSHTIFHKQ